MALHRKLILLSGSLLAAATLGSPARAAGFYLEEHSVSAMGAAYSGASTNTQDASILYYNPAGMTQLGHGQVTLDATGITAQNNLQNNGSVLLAGPALGTADSDNPIIGSVIPSGFIAYPIWDNKLWAGLGLTTPFGLSSDYNDDWFGRYDSIKSELRTYDAQPTLAYQVTNWLSIGGGVDFQHATADLTNSVTNGVTEGHARLNGDDNAWGWTAGVLLTPMPGTKIALDYRSQVNYDLNGRVVVTGAAGLNEDSAAHAKLDLPAQASIGFSQDIDPRWTVSAQATWFGWSNFNDITAIRDTGTVAESISEDYRNTYNLSLGANYRWSKDWTFRAGYQFDQTPTHSPTRDTRVPDGNRNWLTVGATYNFTPQFSVDMAGAYIRVNDSNIDVTRNGGLATVSAHAKDGQIELLGLGANYKF